MSAGKALTRKVVLPAHVHHRVVRVARELPAHRSGLGSVAPFVLLRNFLKVLNVALQVLLFGSVAAVLQLVEVGASVEHPRLLIGSLGVELSLLRLLARDKLGMGLLILVGSLLGRLGVCHFII